MYKIFIVIGIVFILIGIIIGITGIKIGNLPGDIIIKKDNFTLYFPITTSIILSIILSVLWYLLSK